MLPDDRLENEIDELRIIVNELETSITFVSEGGKLDYRDYRKSSTDLDDDIEREDDSNDTEQPEPQNDDGE